MAWKPDKNTEEARLSGHKARGGDREKPRGLRWFAEGGWEWFELEGASGEDSPPKGAHLFFSGDRSVLQRIARKEILSQGAVSARVSRRPDPASEIYSLELFHRIGESREAMLAFRYENCKGLRYAGWQGGACSMEGFFRKMCVNKRDLGM